MKVEKDAEYYINRITKLIVEAQSKGIDFGWVDTQNFDTGAQAIDIICQQGNDIYVFENNENNFYHYNYITKGFEIVGIKKDDDEN